MDDMNGSDCTLPSIFDDNDNVYGTDALHGDIRPRTLETRERAEAPTRTDTPKFRRS